VQIILPRRKGLMKRFVSGLMLTILITSMLAFMFNVQPVKGEWTGTVYIRADGSIDPPDAPIITYDNATYMLINNIKSSDDGIIVERDNIVVDGEAYAIEGVQKAGTRGVDLSFRRNVTIRNVNIQQFDIGILIQYSIQNSIVENNITNNLFCGVELDYSSFNNINKNKITNNGNGIGLYESSNNTISRNNVLNKNNGFYFAYSSNNIVYANNIVSCRYDGVRLFGSYSNMFFKNNITNHHTGIDLTQSFGNSISENNIANNSDGISLYVSSNNKIFHNNLMANDRQVYDFAWYHPEIMPSINVWDDSYPSGGNYWSDYHGIDLYSGPYQNETGSDGIGDTPYVIDENNVDHYPLMNPWTPKPSVINATVDIQPQALNLRSIGKWITIY
jgi:parallel beta-helix repeat protein